MELNLKKDIVFFDLETTGVSVSKDRIVQMAIIKIFADGRANYEKTRLINPTIPIPPGATKIHGITNGMVELIGDADFGGYNSNRFDIPILIEEFARSGIRFDMINKKRVDVMRIFHELEKRNLAGAYKFYCGKKLEGAHNAMNDIRATVEILKAQLDKYKDVDVDDEHGGIIIKPIQNDMGKLHDFVTDPNELDYQGKVKYDENRVPVFTFGKYQFLPVGENCAKDKGYYNWIINGDFCTDTKKIVRDLTNEYIAQNNGR